jgi:molybdate transport system substrate-binding protein
MKRRFMKSTAAFFCAAMVTAAYSAKAAELTVFATAAHVDSFKELVPAFEKASGHKLTVNFRTSPVTMKGVEAGEPFDVVVAIKGPVDETASKGFFASSDRPVVSVVGLGVAVKAGAAKPQIATADAFKQALLNAKSVVIVPDSVNGKHFLSVFEKLGIADQMKTKTVSAKAPAEVPAALVKGDAEVALFIANGLRAPGVDYVGPVPTEFDQKLVFVTAINAKAKEPKAAAEFVAYLRSPAAIAIMKASGLDTQ